METESTLEEVEEGVDYEANVSGRVVNFDLTPSVSYEQKF